MMTSRHPGGDREKEVAAWGRMSEEEALAWRRARQRRTTCRTGRARWETRWGKYNLGIVEPKLGSHISEATSIPCQSNEFVQELLHGIRLHFDRFICELKKSDLEKAQLGLGHSYSKAKVKFSVNRVDNMVMQAIFLLDTLHKDIDSFSCSGMDGIVIFNA